MWRQLSQLWPPLRVRLPFVLVLFRCCCSFYCCSSYCWIDGTARLFTEVKKLLQTAPQRKQKLEWFWVKRKEIPNWNSSTLCVFLFPCLGIKFQLKDNYLFFFIRSLIHWIRTFTEFFELAKLCLFRLIGFISIVLVLNRDSSDYGKTIS